MLSKFLAMRGLIQKGSGGGGSNESATANAIIEGTTTEIANDTVISLRRYALAGFKTLTSVYFPAVTSLGEYAFYSCTNLSSVDIPAATSIGGYAFQYCSALTSVYFPAVTTVETTAFSNCSALVSVRFPAAETFGSSVFKNCSSLMTADFAAAKSFGNIAFSSCSALTCLIIRTIEKPCTLYGKSDLNNTPIANGTGYIYVPADLVDSYKAATNWAVHANQFRALEDYTVDGTITGELDPTKI